MKLAPTTKEELAIFVIGILIIVALIALYRFGLLHLLG